MSIAEFLRSPAGQGTFVIYNLLFAYTLARTVITHKYNPHKGKFYGILSLTLGVGLLLISLSLVFSINAQESAFLITRLLA